MTVKEKEIIDWLSERKLMPSPELVTHISNHPDGLVLLEKSVASLDGPKLFLSVSDLIIEEKKLVIPLPRYTKRSFVLVPLLEIDNKLVDPKSKIMIKELLGDISSEEILDKIKFPYSKA